jgi:acyl-CoA reductase-like NAD-dependent aldehyde dehydrogenase
MSTPFGDELARCRAAQRSWAELPLRERLTFIRPLRHAFAAQSDRLCLTTTHDVGRPADEVLGTDVLPVADALRFLERHAARILRPKRISGWTRPWWLIGEREAVHRRPRGVVGIIGTWNYPILLNAVTIAQALVAGNGVAWKPSEQAPSVGEYLHGLFLAMGIPADLFVRLPAARETGPQLIEEDIDHLVFTGSAPVGRRVAARLGDRLISSTLELSGCDALFVLEDADISLAARATWFGATLNTGQTCLGVRRAFVHRKRYEEFLAALRPLAANQRPEPLVMFGQAEQAGRLVKDALSSGAELLTGETPSAADEPPRFPPTVVVNARTDMAICQEASFAPLLAVIRFDNEDQLAELAEKCPYGLGASVFTSDIRRGKQLASRLRVGSVSINDALVATAHPATGFGGVRDSGWGVTRGEEGLLSLTVPQVVSTRLGKFRPHFQTTNPALAEMLRGLLAWYHSANGRERRAGFRRTVRGVLRFGKG